MVIIPSDIFCFPFFCSFFLFIYLFIKNFFSKPFIS